MDFLKLSAINILKQDFDIEYNGYNPESVDNFLDQVIQDYQNFEKVFNKINDENKNLKEQILKLHNELEKIKKSLFNKKEIKGEEGK